jgi:hypothetical protein
VPVVGDGAEDAAGSDRRREVGQLLVTDHPLDLGKLEFCT